MVILNSRYDTILPTTDSKVHGTNMGPTWVLSAPDGPHVGPMNLAIRDSRVIATVDQKPYLELMKDIPYFILMGSYGGDQK